MTEAVQSRARARSLAAHFVLVAASAAAWAPKASWATPLAVLDLPAYMGLWHQVALIPNRFQAQCLDSTTATYTLLQDGRVKVLNRCRTQNGWDETEGIARLREGVERRAGGVVAPASLEVSFLPVMLRWLGVGWGKYDVLQLGAQQEWAVVSEPSRQFLWVLARTPQLDAAQWAAVEAQLVQGGFDLTRLKREPLPAPATPGS